MGLSVPLISVILGALLPLLKKLARALRDDPKSSHWFSSAFGKEVLEILGLNKPVDAPEALFDELHQASQKMDSAISKIQEYTRMREVAIVELETKMGQLTGQETELRRKIDTLRRTPLPAAEYFASMVGEQEKSSALRDYILFAAGVVVSAIVAIVVKHFGWD